MDVETEDCKKPVKSINSDQYKTWVEKYRPKKLDEVVYQNEIVDSLKSMILKNNAANLPNLLFYGPPGTGKTSTIIALAKEIFGTDYKTRVLELNASDERGIHVIREKVKKFAQQITSTSDNIPPIKIIVFDECDSMTKDAQSALRRIMEKYSSTTRFCLICNYVSRILDSIASRCSTFRFKPLRKDLVEETLKVVCEKEGFEIKNDSLESLIEVSDGDLRRAITLLQTISAISDTKVIELNDILELSGQIPLELIKKFFNVCRSKSYKFMIEFVDKFIISGYSGEQFIFQLQQFISLADESLLNDQKKSIICQEIVQNYGRLLEGADEFIQLINIGSCMIQTISD